MQKITFFLCKERSKETPTNDFFKIRRRRRTCADDGDTYREIYPKIVCEEPATSARFWGKFCRRGCKAARCLRQNQRGGAGAAVAECKRRTKARRMMRKPQPVLQMGETGVTGTAVHACCPR